MQKTIRFKNPEKKEVNYNLQCKSNWAGKKHIDFNSKAYLAKWVFIIEDNCSLLTSKNQLKQSYYISQEEHGNSESP